MSKIGAGVSTKIDRKMTNNKISNVRKIATVWLVTRIKGIQSTVNDNERNQLLLGVVFSWEKMKQGSI